MKGNFRMTIFGFVLLLSFLLSAHPELLEGKFTAKQFGISSVLIREGRAQNDFWSISSVESFMHENVAGATENQSGTIRAFLYGDKIFVEQFSPRKTFLISGSFAVPTSFLHVYFSDNFTLIIPVKIPNSVSGAEVLLRAHLDQGTIEFLAI